MFAARLNARFGTDRFTVYNAGMGGGKQPQQYFKLVYLDLLGFKPDIVINYDGFNELAIPSSENADLGSPAIFPSVLRAPGVELECGACVRGHQQPPHAAQQRAAAGRADRRRLRRTLQSAHPASPRAVLVDRVPAAGGPIRAGARSRDIWRESTNRLFEFTKARGIDYLHVLQPNQYLLGGKTLSEQEQKEFTNRPQFGEHVRLHYAAFSRAGVDATHFRDQRYLFRDNAETLYNDNCCHFSEKGIEYISDDIISTFHDVLLRACACTAGASAAR